MDNRFRDNFYLIWIAAVVICALAALFSVLFVSCSRGGSDGSAPTAKAAAVTAIDTDQAAPEAVIPPEAGSAAPEAEAEPETMTESEETVPQDEAVTEDEPAPEEAAPEGESDLAGMFEIAPAVNP